MRVLRKVDVEGVRISAALVETYNLCNVQIVME